MSDSVMLKKCADNIYNDWIRHFGDDDKEYLRDVENFGDYSYNEAITLGTTVVAYLHVFICGNTTRKCFNTIFDDEECIALRLEELSGDKIFATAWSSDMQNTNPIYVAEWNKHLHLYHTRDKSLETRIKSSTVWKNYCTRFNISSSREDSELERLRSIYDCSGDNFLEQLNLDFLV